MSTHANVLIVEQPPATSQSVARELDRAGLEPTCLVATSEEHFRALLDPRPDVIVAGLPGASRKAQFGALEALAVLQECGLAIPLIVISEASDAEEAVTCMKRGAADYVRANRIGPAVVEALDRRPAREVPDAMLRALLDTTPDVVIFKDLHHVFLACSRAKCEQSGLSEDQLIGRTDFEFFSPDTAERFRAEEELVVATGERIVAEHLLDTPNGPRWYEAIKRPVRDAQGQIVGVLCSERDITDRKARENSLRENERRLKGLQQALTDLTASETLNNGSYEDACREAVEVSTRTLEVARAAVWSLSDDLPVLRAIDRYELTTDCHSQGAEFDLSHHAGTLRALMDNRIIAADDVRTNPATRDILEPHLTQSGTAALLAAPIRAAGHVLGVVTFSQIGSPRQWSPEEQAFAGSVADMLSLVQERVSRRRIEAERDEQRRLLRVVLDTLPDFILFKDTQSVFLGCNRAFGEFLGRSEAEIIGRTDHDLFPKEDAQLYADEERHVLESGQTIVNEHQLFGSHGTRWDEAIKTPLRDESGQIIGVLTAGRDITRRKRAQAERDEQRRLLRAVLDTTPDLVVFKDRDLVFRMINQSCAHFHGRTVESMIGLTDFDLRPADSAQKFRDEELRVLESGETLVVERSPTADDSRWVETVKTRVCEDAPGAGDVLGILVTVRDITDRKRAETERDEQRRMLRTLIDTNPDLITFKDRDSIFRIVNEAYAQSWGRPASEIIGLSDVDLFPPERARQFRADELRLMETGEPIRGEFWRDTPSGQRWVEFIKTRVCEDNGNVLGVLVNIRDLTDRKRAETERDEQRRMLLAVLDTTPDRIVYKDRDSVFRLVNAAAARDWDRTPAEMIGLTDFDLWPPDQAAAYREEEIRVMETGEPLVVERLRPTRSGARWTEVVKTPLCDDEGKVLGVLINVRDIDSRKQAAEVQARRVREMTALYETSLAINAQHDLSTLLQSIVRRAADLLGGGVGELHLMRSDGRALEMAGSYNLPESSAQRVANLGEGMTGRTAQSGEILMLEDYSTWEDRIYDMPNLHRALSVPLKRGAQVIGVLTIFDVEKTGPFDDDEVRLVNLFADQATIALQNTRLFESAQRELVERIRAEEEVAQHAREMTALYETSLALNTQRDLSTLLQTIVEAAVRLIGTGAGVGELFLIRPDGETLQLAASYNMPYREPNQIIDVGKGLAGRTARDNEPQFIEDYSIWDGRLCSEVELRRALSVPLRRGSQAIGVLNIFDVDKVGPFDENEIRLVQLFVDQATVAIENARLYEAVQRERDFSAGVLATTETAVGVFDPEGRILLFNRKCQELTGYTEEEMLGRVLWEVLIPADDVERVKQAMGSWPDQEPPNYYENAWLTKDGRSVPLVWRNGILRNPNGQVLFISSGMDISERVSREQEIERRNRELTLLYETLRAASSSLDPCEVYRHVAQLARNARRVSDRQRPAAQRRQTGALRIRGLPGIQDGDGPDRGCARQGDAHRGAGVRVRCDP